MSDSSVVADRALDRMQRVVDRAARARRDLPEPQVLLRAPGVEFAAGDRSRRFHTASVGKTMTATLAFQLHERGALDLDAPVSDLLPEAETADLFTDARAVTVRHLLTHTSGVADYFEGRTTSGPRFATLLATEPDRRWGPGDLLEFARAHQRPLGAPGARFAYSDTGYVVLGRIIEEAGAASLGAQLHERILAPAGMADSCLAFHTLPGGADAGDALPGDTLDLAPLRVGDLELGRTAALSCDWAGGGVVSTLDDLIRFADAWRDDTLLGAASRATMATFGARFRPGIRYGAGLMQLRYRGFSPLLRLPHAVGHLGVTGVHLFWVPEHDVRLAMNFHSTREMLRSFRVHIELMRAALR